MISFLLFRDWLAMTLGYRRLAYTTLDPPNHLIREVPSEVEGQTTFIRPKGVLKTEVVLKFTIRQRLRLLLSGKVQVINITWLEIPTVVMGDSFNWAVLPPYDRVDPKLKV